MVDDGMEAGVSPRTPGSIRRQGATRQLCHASAIQFGQASPSAPSQVCLQYNRGLSVGVVPQRESSMESTTYRTTESPAGAKEPTIAFVSLG
jgi:hypothetical protein